MMFFVNLGIIVDESSNHTIRGSDVIYDQHHCLLARYLVTCLSDM